MFALNETCYSYLQGHTLTIDQMLSQLEQQKATIERAIAALRELSATGLQPGAAVPLGFPTKKRRGRPPKSAQSSPATESDNTTPPHSPSASRTKKVRRPVYTEEFKRRVVRAVRDGMSFGQASKKFRTTWFSVREWTNSGQFEPATVKKTTSAGSSSAPAKKSAVKKNKATGKKAIGKSANSGASKKSAPTKSATEAGASTKTATS